MIFATGLLVAEIPAGDAGALAGLFILVVPGRRQST